MPPIKKKKSLYSHWSVIEGCARLWHTHGGRGIIGIGAVLLRELTCVYQGWWQTSLRTEPFQARQWLRGKGLYRMPEPPRFPKHSERSPPALQAHTDAWLRGHKDSRA